MRKFSCDQSTKSMAKEGTFSSALRNRKIVTLRAWRCSELFVAARKRKRKTLYQKRSSQIIQQNKKKKKKGVRRQTGQNIIDALREMLNNASSRSRETRKWPETQGKFGNPPLKKKIHLNTWKRNEKFLNNIFPSSPDRQVSHTHKTKNGPGCKTSKNGRVSWVSGFPSFVCVAATSCLLIHDLAPNVVYQVTKAFS